MPSLTVNPLPKPNLDWILIGEPASAQDPSVSVLYPNPPSGVPNRPLFELLQNDYTLQANIAGVGDQLLTALGVVQNLLSQHQGTNWKTAHPGASTDWNTVQTQIALLNQQLAGVLPVYTSLTAPGYVRFGCGLVFIWFEDLARTITGNYGVQIPWPVASNLNVQSTLRGQSKDITGSNNTSIQEDLSFGISGGLLVLQYRLLNSNATFPSVIPSFLMVANDTNNGITGSNQAPTVTGPFSITVTNGTFSGSNPWGTGAVIAVSANAPGGGLSFAYWTVTSGTAIFLDPNTSNSHVILFSNATIAPVYLGTPGSPVTITVSGGGLAGGANPFQSGTLVPIVANPPPAGYYFSGWTVTSGTGTVTTPSAASTTVNATTNVTVTASYTALPSYALTVTNGALIGSNPFQSGIPISIVANAPAPGMVFSNWTVTSGSAVIANSSSSLTTVAITSAATVQANYVAAPTVTLTVTNGTIVSGSNPFAQGALVTVLANPPATGFQFSNWTVISGTMAITVPNNTTTTVAVNSTGTIQANYIPIPPVTLTLIGGTMTGGPSVLPGTVIPIAASIPAPGQEFSSWQLVSGNAIIASPTSPTSNVTVNTSATIQALTVAIPNVTVVVQNDGSTMSLPTGSGSYPPNSTIAIIAPAAPAGFVFKNWTIISGTPTITNPYAASTTAVLSGDSPVIQANYYAALGVTSFQATGYVSDIQYVDPIYIKFRVGPGSNVNVSVLIEDLLIGWSNMWAYLYNTDQLDDPVEGPPASPYQQLTFGAAGTLTTPGSQTVNYTSLPPGDYTVVVWEYPPAGVPYVPRTLRKMRLTATITSGTSVFTSIGMRCLTDNIGHFGFMQVLAGMPNNCYVAQILGVDVLPPTWTPSTPEVTLTGNIIGGPMSSGVLAPTPDSRGVVINGGTPIVAVYGNLNQANYKSVRMSLDIEAP